MADFIRSFAWVFVGSIIAGFLIAYFDAHFRRPSHSDTTDAILYPRSKLLRSAAFIVFAIWATFAVFILLITLNGMGVLHSPSLFEGSIVTLAGLCLLYIALASTLRCQQCGKHLIIQWIEAPEFADRIKGLDGWASILLRVSRRKPFQCMYCGQHYLP